MKVINKQVALGGVALIAIGLVFFAGSISRANDEYITVKTTITSMFPVMEFTWCDNEHLLVRKNDDELYQQTLKTTHTTTPEKKLYYVDVTGKTSPQVIDLNPFGTNIERALCKNGEILIPAYDDALKVFRLTIGGEPDVLVHTPKQSRIILTQLPSGSGQYVFSTYRSGEKDADADKAKCSAYYIKAGYRQLCWDRWSLYTVGETLWLLSNFVLAQYIWHDEVRYKDARDQWVTIANPAGKNPDKSLQLKLYDLEQNELAILSKDPVYGIDVDVAISPDERFAYAACGKRGRKEGTGLDRVCRYRLNGGQHSWEEVFNFDPEGKYELISIQQLNVGPRGDVYFIELGARNHNYGIWKFDASSKQVRKITRPPNRPDEHPRVSPDGKRVAFVGLRDGTYALLIAQPNK